MMRFLRFSMRRFAATPGTSAAPGDTRVTATGDRRTTATGDVRVVA